MPSIATAGIAVLLASVRMASGAFSLGVGGPDWDYTASDLAPTTSQACKDAYANTPIDCDATLLGIVASAAAGLRPGARPTWSARACRRAPDSVDAYIATVSAACGQPGDRAQVALNSTAVAPQGPGRGPWARVFQWKFRQACATNE